MLFDRSAKAKWRKELKNELKDLQKTFVAAGCDKAEVTSCFRELQESLDLGEELHNNYKEARAHLGTARTTIPKLLDCMGESPAAEVEKSLNELVSDLELVYHDCSIREDDMDFASTIRSLKQMVGQYTASVAQAKTEAGRAFSSIMLRSELENIKAVLDDASAWNAPDFLALAYFFLHEDRAALGEMENEQRNQYVRAYWDEHFGRKFAGLERTAGREHVVDGLVERYIFRVDL